MSRRFVSIATLGAWALALHLAAACGGQDETAEGGAAGSSGCPPGEAEAAGSCQPAGVPDSGCGAGFAPDGRSSCVPVLPDDPCPAGAMAVPGDAACREVAPCPGGRWGQIPVDATTVFVDASYAVGDGDGTEAKPFPTLLEAIAAAPPGALVALATGTYVGRHHLVKSLRIWGRAPPRSPSSAIPSTLPSSSRLEATVPSFTIWR